MTDDELRDNIKELLLVTMNMLPQTDVTFLIIHSIMNDSLILQ
jgi:hypothetical protein